MLFQQILFIYFHFFGALFKVDNLHVVHKYTNSNRLKVLDRYIGQYCQRYWTNHDAMNHGTTNHDTCCCSK